MVPSDLVGSYTEFQLQPINTLAGPQPVNQVKSICKEIRCE